MTRRANGVTSAARVQPWHLADRSCKRDTIGSFPPGLSADHLLRSCGRTTPACADALPSRVGLTRRPPATSAAAGRVVCKLGHAAPLHPFGEQATLTPMRP